MKLDVRHAGGELTVGSQKEFLKLYQSGIIAADDLVRREGQSRWIPAGQLPGISSMRAQGQPQAALHHPRDDGLRAPRGALDPVPRPAHREARRSQRGRGPRGPPLRQRPFW